MNVIGFSHHYKKLHGQTTAELIDVRPFTVNRLLAASKKHTDEMTHDYRQANLHGHGAESHRSKEQIEREKAKTSNCMRYMAISLALELHETSRQEDSLNTFLEYDTEIESGRGESFIVDDGHYLLLTFLGNYHIPFTTVRKIPMPCYKLSEADERTLMEEGEVVNGRVDYRPYQHLIGQLFAIKFKGEPLDKDIAEAVMADQQSAKIYE